MAEWWVDPENGLTTNAGTSSSVPWKLIPGQTGATAQTGYSVAAGDTINVRNGTTTTLRIIAPANNLTYRGYGLASNVLWLLLPSGLGTALVRVVRESGVHEGMWIVDDGTTGTYGMFTSSTRSGITVEDMKMVAVASDTPISFGISTSAAIGVTLRRSHVYGSTAIGVDCYSRQATIEDCRIENIDDDGVTFGASATNGYRAGYPDRIERVSFINVGLDTVTAVGDAFQTFHADDRWEAPLIIRDVYVYKPNTVKQAITLVDLLGGCLIERFRMDGPTQSHSQILMSGVRGNVVIRQGVFSGGCWSNPAIRTAGNAGVSMATGSKITIESVFLLAHQHNGLFAWGGTAAPATVDGEVVVQGCYAEGEALGTLSYSGVLSCAGSGAGGVTVNASARFTAQNNIILATDGGDSPAFRMPSGGAGDSRWVFRNNVVAPALELAIGSTIYANLADFIAAHSSTGNLQVDPLLDASYRPMAGSPCIGAGVYIPGARDFSGRKLKRTPDIGARQYYASRGVVSPARTALAVLRDTPATLRSTRSGVLRVGR